MRLALSSAAVPTAALDELVDAAARRGLPAVELVEGHGHALEVGGSAAVEAASASRRARAAGITIAGFRLTGEIPAPGADDMEALVRLAVALEAPVLFPVLEDGGGPSVGGWRRTLASTRSLRDMGGEVMVVLPSGPGGLRALDALDALGVPAGGGTGLALGWDADPSAGRLAEVGSAILARVGDRLRHIVLRGGGPEATAQEGRGVGSLMARLALSGYRGTLALAPSSPRYQVIWDAWLGRRGSWGCGSKEEDRTLVSLGGAG